MPKGQAELYQCRSSLASPAPAPPGTWSGQNSAWMGEMVHWKSLCCPPHCISQSGWEGRDQALEKRRPLPCRGLYRGEEHARGCGSPPGAQWDLWPPWGMFAICFIILKAVFADSLFWTALLAVPCLKLWVGNCHCSWCDQKAIPSHQLALVGCHSRWITCELQAEGWKEPKEFLLYLLKNKKGEEKTE